MQLYNVGMGSEGVSSSSDGEEEEDDIKVESAAKKMRFVEVCGNGCNPI